MLRAFERSKGSFFVIVLFICLCFIHFSMQETVDLINTEIERLQLLGKP